MRPDSNGARRIGPIGVAARLVGAVVAIGVPIVLGGLNWWDLAAALVALPGAAGLAAAGVAAGYRAVAQVRPRISELEPWIRGAAVLGTVVAVEIALTFATPLNGATAVWVFLGISIIVAAIRDDAGCEAVAIPNALAGRTDSTGCLLYAPIDQAAEGLRRRGGTR